MAGGRETRGVDDAGLLGRALAIVAARRWLLLTLFAGVLVPLAIFGALAEDVWEQEGFGWDTAILLAVHRHATPTLDRAALLLTNLGAPTLLIGCTVLALAFLAYRRRIVAAIFVALAVGGASVLNLLAKLLFQRHRPTLWPQLTPETDLASRAATRW